jgi:hypothetical protein
LQLCRAATRSPATEKSRGHEANLFIIRAFAEWVNFRTPALCPHSLAPDQPLVAKQRACADKNAAPGFITVLIKRGSSFASNFNLFFDYWSVCHTATSKKEDTVINFA